MADVVIVGGGVIGLLSAVELADRGLTPVVFDAPQRPGASWAGGGILSPLFPWRYSDALNALCIDAVAGYRAIAERIVAVGGPDPEVSATGMLAITDDAPARIGDWLREWGVAGDPVRARDRMPALPDVPAWWLPDVANVRNSRLLPGLRALLQRHRVRIVDEPVVALAESEEGVQVETVRERVFAPRCVISAGAWSTTLAQSLGIVPDVAPVKGQMLLFDAPDAVLKTMLLTEQGYLIPRRDGRILVGSTLEPEPANGLPSREACEQLHALAARLVPALGEHQPAAQWAGLRPGTSRPVPIIDRIAENIWLSTGHYRNGLVAAPASARLLAQMMSGERPEIDPAPYSLSS